MPSETDLREACRDILKSADMTVTTEKMVRRQVETKLGLEEGYLDQPARKAIIKASIKDILNGVEGTTVTKVSLNKSPKKSPKKSPAKSMPVDKSSDMSEVEDDGPPLKKQKKSTDKSKSKMLANSKPKAQKSSENVTSPSKRKKVAPVENESSDSMSEVEDDAPSIKKQKSSSVSTTKDPKSQEKRIARLKSLVFKCGVRKKWQSEFEDCPTPKLQIARLKQILTDLGMKGGFSVEKAEKIREEREFKADVEAIQQNAIIDNDRETRSSRPSKRESPEKKVAATSMIDFSFLGDQSGSDSD